MEPKKSKEQLKKILLYILKAIVAIGILYYVFSKTNFDELKETAAKLKLTTFLCALFFFALSMFFSSIRLKNLINDLNVNISLKTNARLYLLGMFYNLFLPGGVGGDAYKIFFLNKNYGLSTKESFWPFLMDRGSGLFALLVLILICAMFFDFQIPAFQGLIDNKQYIIPAMIGFGFVAVYFIVKWMKKVHLKTFFKTMPLSFLVQLSQALCVFFFVWQFGDLESTVVYIFIFFISSIVSIIPITPGGAGLRETTYHIAASIFMIDEHIGVLIGALIFILNFIVSFFGIYYHFKKIQIDN